MSSDPGATPLPARLRRHAADARREAAYCCGQPTCQHAERARDLDEAAAELERSAARGQSPAADLADAFRAWHGTTKASGSTGGRT